jgi:hypothetical protein
MVLIETLNLDSSKTDVSTVEKVSTAKKPHSLLLRNSQHFEKGHLDKAYALKS